jgi:hypothetical protein
MTGPGSISTQGESFSTANNPSQFCHVSAPWLDGSQVKLAIAYPLPWSLQVAANYQNLPGYPIDTTYVASNNQVKQSLGRNLAACGTATVCNATVTLNNALMSPYTAFEDRLNQVDVRLSRVFRLAGASIQGNFDIYNMLNANTVLTEVTTYSPTNTYLRPTSILAARLIKFGVELKF